MKAMTLKAIATMLVASSLLAGCASTDPSKPQSNDDFVYDSNMSFAMNVVDGSLGFHKGLQDAKAPAGGDASVGALDYAADGIIGAAFGGGIGGAFLSMLGTNQGNAPLDSYYNIVYYPVKAKGNIQAIYDSLEQEFIDTAVSSKGLKFVKKSFRESSKKYHLTFSGEACDKALAKWQFKPSETCSYIHYKAPSLLKYSTSTPDGKKGLFAVIGYEKFFTHDYLSLDLDRKHFVFSPVIQNRTKFPFVSNSNVVHLFISPSNDSERNISSMSIETLSEIDPWVKKHYL